MGSDSGDNSGVRRAVFLDRDGVLNRNIFNPQTGAYESPLWPEDFELLPNVIPALQRLRDAEFSMFLVSNQPNFAKGKASMALLNSIHARLEAELQIAGIDFWASYYCFHHPDFTGACACRKPSPHFLFEAQKTFGIDLGMSWMIGDRESDVACGRTAGTRTILISGEGCVQSRADFIAKDLQAAVDILLS